MSVMENKKFDNYSFTLINGIIVLFFILLCFNGGNYLSSVNNLLFMTLNLDIIFFYLGFLVISLLLIVYFISSQQTSLNTFLLLLSGISSIVCFMIQNSLLFWLFYEMALVSVLILLYLDSPYSERYVASWYFLGYSIFSGVPLLGIFVYISLISGSLYFYDWLYYSEDILVLVVSLCILFSTKIPLVPFHVWLPIVHAEASSLTSICLSGYIMKLGIIGILRSGYYLFPCGTLISLVSSVVVFSSICFFVSSIGEIDGKRWLALLSLSHISLVPVCFISLSDFSPNFSVAFGLGHGLSSAFLFCLIWYLGWLGGTRNILYYGWIVGNNNVIFLFLVIGFCYVASFPPTINFFIEVFILQSQVQVNNFIVFIILLYLFFSSLIPIVLFGFNLTRRLCMSYINGGSNFLLFMIILFFIGLLFLFI